MAYGESGGHVNDVTDDVYVTRKVKLVTQYAHSAISRKQQEMLFSNNLHHSRSAVRQYGRLSQRQLGFL